MTDAKTLGSLFDGAGGFPLAGTYAGFKPVWCSEIEPFPIRVTKKNFPMMEHLGDIAGINGKKITPVDVITFGSPCQDLSIAGKRAGLVGKRSGLFHEAVRIIREMRDATGGEYPKFAVWENVPGALSSNQGEDFRMVLNELANICTERTNIGETADNGRKNFREDADSESLGIFIPRPPGGKWRCSGEIVGNGYSIAWRILDAQYWGVPQRRKRIYLVADFAGRRAGKILFERESLLRNPETGGGERQGAAGGAAPGLGAAGVPCVNPQGSNGVQLSEDKTLTLVAQDHGHHPCILDAAGFCTEHSAKARGIGYEEGKSPTLRAGVVPAAVYENHGQDTRYTGLLETAPTVSATYGTGGNNQPFVVKGTETYDVRFTSDGSKIVRANVYKTNTARTINTDIPSPAVNQGGVAIVECIQGSAIGRQDRNGPQGNGVNEDVSFTLNTIDRHAVAYPAISVRLHPTRVAQNGYIVRRLTPTECARLQGFPDWWCDGLAIENPADEDIAFWRDVFETHRKVIGTSSKAKTDNQIAKWLKNPYSDSAEYKMWGNSLAIPCAYDVLAGIAEELGESDEERVE